MGMIGQVQFMNLATAGETGSPPETKAMSGGLAWANVAFDPPWMGDNASAPEGLIAGRRLLQTTTSPGESTRKAKTTEQIAFEGVAFYNAMGLIGVAALHWCMCKGIAGLVDVSTKDLPASMQFPGWELGAFQAMWAPITLGSTSAYHSTLFCSAKRARDGALTRHSS